MTVRQMVLCCLLSLLLAGPAVAQTTQPADQPYGQDEFLDAARKYVAEHGDRYMDHHKLTRGMKGYGLTVMAGMDLMKFDVEIVSVMMRSGPHQDVILARLTGLDLEKSGIIAGMSGSPCYIKDADGKDKLIGAVAFGWSFQKEPLCGIQPITQMLAVPGFLPRQKPASSPASASEPTSMPAPSLARTDARPSREYLATVLNPRKLDFALLDLDRPAGATNIRNADGQADARSALVPLSTPLMIGGGNGRPSAAFTGMIKSMNFLPVQAGGVSATGSKAAEDFKFVPGCAVSIPLVRGDNDLNAVGTVTDVVGDKILIFGHAFSGSSPSGSQADGDIEFPMGPAYVHTVVAGYQESFKMASALPPIGAAVRDEQVGVAGVVGKKVEMIPVTINVTWKSDNRKQTFNYEIVRHRKLTAAAMKFCIHDATSGWHDLPNQNIVTYGIEIDFGKLGTYKAANVSADEGMSGATSDALRPVTAFLQNPFGQPIPPKSVKMDFTVEEGNNSAEILSLKLDGATYRPGETVTGQATVRPFRQEPRTLAVSFKLPEAITDGTHRLSICDASGALAEMTHSTPQKFDPRSEVELLAGLNLVATPQGKDLYAYLPLSKGGLAIGQKELPELPASKARIISEAGLLDTQSFSDTQFVHTPTQYVLKGKASAEFSVEINPTQTILRPQESSK